nr:disease resistance protein rpm1 [Quercus suber]
MGPRTIGEEFSAMGSKCGEHIPVSDGSVEDVLIWPLTPNGTYSVQIAYRMLEANANSQKPSSSSMDGGTRVTETNAIGRVKTCRVHDVMRELAMTISEKQNFCTAYDGNESRLFNLRYLNLRDIKISELPKSIKKLRNLQTLDVWNTNVRRLPSGISKLTRLRHLYMYCNNYQNSETSNIANSMMAPTGIWNIQCLQTLACIDVEEELIQKVGNLTELRRLDIT